MEILERLLPNAGMRSAMERGRDERHPKPPLQQQQQQQQQSQSQQQQAPTPSSSSSGPSQSKSLLPSIHQALGLLEQSPPSVFAHTGFKSVPQSPLAGPSNKKPFERLHAKSTSTVLPPLHAQYSSYRRQDVVDGKRHSVSSMLVDRATGSVAGAGGGVGASSGPSISPSWRSPKRPRRSLGIPSTATSAAPLAPPTFARPPLLSGQVRPFQKSQRELHPRASSSSTSTQAWQSVAAYDSHAQPDVSMTDVSVLATEPLPSSGASSQQVMEWLEAVSPRCCPLVTGAGVVR
ncbi:hypothetical protein KEM52_006517 [Ascosphaera acerosa]|nr:hypothetical protein KEM52_006517 [Ascosphaera acerosa]